MPPEAITEFIQLFKEQYGITLTQEEAVVHALALYKIYQAVLI